MKKLILSISALMLITSANAQTDTLFPPSRSKSCFTKLITYYQGGYGYISGTNKQKDAEIAQAYWSDNPITISGVLARLYAPSKGSNSDISAKIWNTDYNTGGPALEVGESNAIKMSDVKNIGFTTFIFPKPVTVNNPFKQGNSDFFVSIVFPTGANDTLAVYSTEKGCYSNEPLAWVLNYLWASMNNSYSGQFTCDLIILPIVGTITSIDGGDYFINGIKLNQNVPNPVFNSTFIQYELEKTSSVVFLEVFDISGKLLFTLNEGRKQTGKHYIKLDTDKLPQGTYFYSLTADENRLTKEMILSK